jgi:hypothetical protein
MNSSEHNLDMMKLAQNNIKGVMGFLQEKEKEMNKDKKVNDKNK